MLAFRFYCNFNHVLERAERILLIVIYLVGFTDHTRSNVVYSTREHGSNLDSTIFACNDELCCLKEPPSWDGIGIVRL